MRQHERIPGREGFKEIERRFLVKFLPDNLERYLHREINQGYILILENGLEVRVRKDGERYFQTIKSGYGKIREEIEIEITEEQFKSLWKMTEGKRIEKIRYSIPYGNQIIELDIYRGSLEGFISVEVEFDSPEASEQFIPPDWFGEEVTEDSRYKNQNLVLYGSPRETLSNQKKMKEELNIPVYDLEQGVLQLTELIRRKRSEIKGPLIVEVAGGSA
jgi:CYTH domain-containing protein